MTGQIILALIVGLPLALGLLFRVSTSHVFFSLMAGELLGRYFGHDIEHQAGSLSKVNITGYGEAVLLVAPMVLTVIFLRGSISKGKALLHTVPLAITGVIFATFLLPVLPDNAQQKVVAYPPGEWLFSLNKAIIGAMVVLQLVSLWLLTRRERGHRK